MPGLSAEAIGMLILGIILFYVLGLGLGIFRAWRASKAKRES